MKILKVLAKLYVIFASITGTIGLIAFIYAMISPGYTWKPGDYIAHRNN